MKQFQKIDTSQGIHDIHIKMYDSIPWHMRIIFPKESNVPRPLIIALHWAGGGDTYKQYSSCLVEPAFAKMEAIIICPDAQNKIWSSEEMEKGILRLVELAKTNWLIDSTKIIVTGYSNGGNGAWFYAEKYPKLFTAAIPMASAYPLSQKIAIPVYAIHGMNDELFDINQTRIWVKEAQTKNPHILFKPVKGLSHYEACQYVQALSAAVDWLEDNE